MLNDFRNRLRKQTGTPEAASPPMQSGGVKDAAEALMAWEQAAPDVLFETRTQVTQVEAEWREKTYQQLLKVMDLSCSTRSGRPRPCARSATSANACSTSSRRR